MANARDSSANSGDSSLLSHRGSASPYLSGRTLLTAWLVSIFVHAALFACAFLFVFQVSQDAQPAAVVRTEMVASMETIPQIDSIRLPLRAGLDVPSDSQPRPTPKDFSNLSDMPIQPKSDLSVVTLDSGGEFSSGGFVVGGAGPVEFFGVSDSRRAAKSVVYVVDRSGSMSGAPFRMVQEELRRSITALRASHRFHIIFFDDHLPIEAEQKRLVHAILSTKQRSVEWLDYVVTGKGTDPSVAMRRALALKPDLIYLLSDGDDFPRGFLQKLDRWNRDRQTSISTIAFEGSMDGQDILKRIARGHNGEFTFVSVDEFP